jgi:hypothetical protein
MRHRENAVRLLSNTQHITMAMHVSVVNPMAKAFRGVFPDFSSSPSHVWDSNLSRDQVQRELMTGYGTDVNTTWAAKTEEEFVRHELRIVAGTLTTCNG